MLTAPPHDPPGNGGDGHPENPARTWFCENARHPDCKGTVVTPGGQDNRKCECDCHGKARTKRHDWLDERFDDEIELERAVADAPSMPLARSAELAGVGRIDGAWRYLGRFPMSTKRSPTADARWTLGCRTCPKGDRRGRVRTTLLHVSERFYRVGRCGVCGTSFWFELAEPTRA